MDIQHLIDRLEDLVDEGQHVPFSRYTMLDEERALEIIDQMRISVPEEIEKSARVLANRGRILEQAEEDANRIVQQARRDTELMLDEGATVQAAQNRAANIIEAARQEAELIADEADRYVLQELARMEREVARMLTVVRNGIQEVSSHRPGLQVRPEQDMADELTAAMQGEADMEDLPVITPARSLSGREMQFAPPKPNGEEPSA